MDTNKMSLSLLTNPIYLSQNKKNTEIHNSVEDIKFYRHRLTTMFRDILKDTKKYNDDINHAHQALIYYAIKQFKSTDRGDILQQEYDNMNIIDNMNVIDISNNKEDIEGINDANEGMFRQPTHKLPLHNFITIKSDNDNPKKKAFKAPNRKNINLKDRKFRKKKI